MVALYHFRNGHKRRTGVINAILNSVKSQNFGTYSCNVRNKRKYRRKV